MKWLKAILDRKLTRAAKPPTTRKRANCVEKNSSLSTFIGGFGESLANLDAFGNRAVFGVVVGGIRHEESVDAGAHGRKLREEIGRAYRLSELVAGGVAGEYPVVREIGVDALHVAHHLVDELRRWPAVLRMRRRHVERDVDHVMRQRIQVGVLDDARNLHAVVVGVHPEIPGERALELEQDADYADVLDRGDLCELLRGQVGSHGRDVLQRYRRDDRIAV